MKDYGFSIESIVNASREEVWKHVTQMRNVNNELHPYVQMTYPADKSELTGQEIPFHETLFKSKLLLFGFIPVDIHSLKLDKLEMGSAFYENSSSLMHRYWKHTRILKEIDPGKTLVRDEIHFMPRFAPAGKLLLPVIKAIFENRHQNLSKYFGG